MYLPTFRNQNLTSFCSYTIMESQEYIRTAFSLGFWGAVMIISKKVALCLCFNETEYRRARQQLRADHDKKKKNKNNICLICGILLAVAWSNRVKMWAVWQRGLLKYKLPLNQSILQWYPGSDMRIFDASCLIQYVDAIYSEDEMLDMCVQRLRGGQLKKTWKGYSASYWMPNCNPLYPLLCECCNFRSRLLLFSQ